MIAELPPLEETVIGREMIGIGMERGLERGMESMVISLLERRFGKLSAELRGKIDRLNPAQLQELGYALLEAENLAGIETWLAKVSPQGQ